MSKEAVVIRMEAKPEKAKQLEEFLKGKIAQVQKEPGIPSWYILKFSEVCMSIFASFKTESAAHAHQKSELLQSIFDVESELMIKQPVVIPVELLASKIGDEVEIAPSVTPGVKKYNLRFVDGL